MQRAAMHPLLHSLYDAERALLPPGTCWFDAHTHVGRNDPDGVTGTAEELLADLDDAGHERAVVFAMHEPRGYAEVNAQTRALAAKRARPCVGADREQGVAGGTARRRRAPASRSLRQPTPIPTASGARS